MHVSYMIENSVMRIPRPSLMMLNSYPERWNFQFAPHLKFFWPIGLWSQITDIQGSSFIIPLFDPLKKHYGKCSKISKHQKGKNTLNLFSILTIEAKGSNQFCKRRQLKGSKKFCKAFAKLVTYLTEFLVFFFSKLKFYC